MALDGRDNQDELWLMLFEEGFYRFRLVYHPDPVTGAGICIWVVKFFAGLLPRDDPVDSEEATEVERGRDENMEQRVIEVDTSDEELEREEGMEDPGLSSNFQRRLN